MAKCLRCGRKGLFLKLNWQNYCESCEIAAAEEKRRLEKEQAERAERERAAYLKKLEEEEARRNADPVFRMKRKPEETNFQHLAELTKPFKPPVSSKSFHLECSHPDKAFYVPDDLRSAALKVPPHQKLTLMYEPENTYDPDAIAVYHGDVKIGYLYKGNDRDMVVDFDRDERKDMLIVSKYWLDRPRLDMFFYVHSDVLVERVSLRPGAATYALIGSRSEEVQLNLSLCEVGDTVDVDYDFDKNKYSVTDSSGDILGYLPDSAASFFDTHSDFVACISKLSESDTGRYTASITVAPSN